MSGQGPLISVVMCVKNGMDHLPDALASLAAQTYDAFELVFIDDGSADSTSEIARSCSRIDQLLEGPSLGLAAARNLGLAAATGEYVTFLDHDDLYHPTRLERIVNTLGELGRPKAIWTGLTTFVTFEGMSTVGPGYERVGSSWPGWRIEAGREREVLLCSGNAIDTTGSAAITLRDHESALTWCAAGSASVIARTSLVTAGGFPTSFGPAEDFQMLKNVARLHPIMELDQPTYFYRLRDDSETRTMGIPWPYIATLFATRFGGQHMPIERALGRRDALPQDGVFEDLLIEGCGATPLLEWLNPVSQILDLLYPNRRERLRIKRRIATKLLKVRAPRIDTAVRRVLPRRPGR